MLDIDPTQAIPIWKQIEDGVRYLVASGRLASDAPVPSVRELARELRVNPATVSKAYRRLTDDGVLAVRRGEGTFVASEPLRLDPGDGRRQLLAGARRYAALAVTVQSDLAAAQNAVAEAWAEASGADQEDPGENRKKEQDDD